MTAIKHYLFILITCFSIGLFAQSPHSVSGENDVWEGYATRLIASEGSGATFNWYPVETRGTPIFTGQSFTTPNLVMLTFDYSKMIQGYFKASKDSIKVYPNPTHAEFTLVFDQY